MKTIAKRVLAVLLGICFLTEQTGFPQTVPQAPLPAYIQQLMPAESFRPLHLRYLAVNSGGDFELLLDRGDSTDLSSEQVDAQTADLMKYFRIGVSLPDSTFWVNLRPDGEEEIIDPLLERTDMGRIMLEADLQLKKDLARMTDPKTVEGKRYWEKLYARAGILFGPQEDMEIPTLARPWIVPGEIIIGEGERGAYVYKAVLSVMLEQDHLKDSAKYDFSDPRLKQLNEYAAGLIRSSILPRLIREINSAKRYAALRQVYYSLVLAQWYKQRFKSPVTDNKDLTGLTSAVAWSKRTYFEAYRRSFQQGEYNQEETLGSGNNLIMRQYTNGGENLQIAEGEISFIKDTKGNLGNLSNVVSGLIHKVVRTVSLSKESIEDNTWVQRRKDLEGGFDEGVKYGYYSPHHKDAFIKLGLVLHEIGADDSIGRFFYELKIEQDVDLLSQVTRLLNSSKPGEKISEENLECIYRIIQARRFRNCATAILQNPVESKELINKFLRAGISARVQTKIWSAVSLSDDPLQTIRFFSGLIVVSEEGSIAKPKEYLMTSMAHAIGVHKHIPDFLSLSNMELLEIDRLAGSIADDFEDETIKETVLEKILEEHDPDFGESIKMLKDLLELKMIFLQNKVSTASARQMLVSILEGNDAQKRLDRILSNKKQIGVFSGFIQSLEGKTEKWEKEYTGPLFSGWHYSDSVGLFDVLSDHGFESLMDEFMGDFLALYTNRVPYLMHSYIMNHLLKRGDPFPAVHRFIKLMQNQNVAMVVSPLCFHDRMAVINYALVDGLVDGTIPVSFFEQAGGDHEKLLKLILADKTIRRSMPDWTFLGLLEDFGRWEDKDLANLISLFKELASAGTAPAPADSLDEVVELIAQQISRRETTIPGLEQAQALVSQGKMQFDNPLHLLANLLLVREECAKLESSSNNVQRWVPQALHYSNFTKLVSSPGFRAEKLSEIPEEDMRDLRGLVYEAGEMFKHIEVLKENAERQQRKVVVIANLSYGGVAIAPITEVRNVDNQFQEYIIGSDIPVWETKIGSTESHNDEYVWNDDLLTPEQIDFLAREQPLVVIVDGTTSVADPGRTSAHVSDAFKGYRNFFMALNEALFKNSYPDAFGVDKKFSQELFNNIRDRVNVDRGGVWSSLASIKDHISSPLSKPFDMHFYYYREGAEDESDPDEKSAYLWLREGKEKDRFAPKADLKAMRASDVIFMVPNIHPEDVDKRAEDNFIRGDYTTGSFDDTKKFKILPLVYDNENNRVVIEPANEYILKSKELFGEYAEFAGIGQELTGRDGGIASVEQDNRHGPASDYYPDVVKVAMAAFASEANDPATDLGQVVKEKRQQVLEYRQRIEELTDHVLRYFNRDDMPQEVYYPFGGTDVMPFMMRSKKAGAASTRKVVSVGMEDFGTPVELLHFFKNAGAQYKSGGGIAVDSVRDFAMQQHDTGISSSGATAIARIISFLGGTIEEIAYFNIQEDGKAHFFHKDEMVNPLTSDDFKKVIPDVDARQRLVKVLKEKQYLQDNGLVSPAFIRTRSSQGSSFWVPDVSLEERKTIEDILWNSLAVDKCRSARVVFTLPGESQPREYWYVQHNLYDGVYLNKQHGRIVGEHIKNRLESAGLLKDGKPTRTIDENDFSDLFGSGIDAQETKEFLDYFNKSFKESLYFVNSLYRDVHPDFSIPALLKAGLIDKDGVIQPSVLSEQASASLALDISDSSKKRLLDELRSAYGKKKGFIEFMEKKKIEMMLIKAANNMWGEDEGGAGGKYFFSPVGPVKNVYEQTVGLLNDDTMIISDNKAKGSISKETHPIWEVPPEEATIPGLRYGYNHEKIYFGPGSRLKERYGIRPVAAPGGGSAADQLDGGTKNTKGGIDFRALPASAAAIDTAAMRKLAQNSKMTDLDKEWQTIEKAIQGQSVPYDRIHEYLAVCCQRQDRAHQAQAAAWIHAMLRAEEECALPATAEMKQILQLAAS